MAVEYCNIVPIRFTNAQLAHLDEVAAQFKIKRSTLIRDEVLSALSKPAVTVNKSVRKVR
jgi:hypothetical protein